MSNGYGKHVRREGAREYSYEQTSRTPQAQAHNRQSYDQQARALSRSAYTAQSQQGRQVSHTAEFNMGPKKRSKAKTVLLVILALLLIVLLAVGIAVFAYMRALNDVLALDPGEKDAVEAVLAESTAGEPYYVLLIGSDGREGVEGSDALWAGHDGTAEDQRSDVMILARIDEANKQVTLLSIPRDTAWQFEDGSWGKLNNVYRVGGIPACVEAVSELSGVPISHVVEIHMSGLMDLVDLVGGITIDVEIPIDYHEALTFEDIHLDAGVQRLNGAETEVYARERVAYRGMYDYPDMHRQSVVRTIVEAIIDEVRQKPLTELPGIILEGVECMDTDYSAEEVLTLLLHLGSDFTMYQGTAPYQGDYNEYQDGLWLTYLNPDGWARVMAVVDAGGDPSTVTYDDDNVVKVGQAEAEAAEEAAMAEE